MMSMGYMKEMDVYEYEWEWEWEWEREYVLC